MITNSQNQEIDLGQIVTLIKKIFVKSVNRFFSLVFFIKKKVFTILSLFLLGFIMAFILDAKVYNHEISVIPNFGSNEYLYKKIEQINVKIKEKDTAFFKEIGLKKYKKIIKIEIEAYPAIYNFVNNKEQENNFELIKLMAEDGSIDKIMKNELTSKNYYHQKISIKTKGKLKREEFIDPILAYINSSPYFETQQKVYQKNLANKIILNDSIIKQIDNIIIKLSSQNTTGTLSISEKNSIPELIEKKDELIKEKHELLTNENIYDKIVKEESSVINIRDYKPLLLNNKILFPSALIFLYLMIYLIIKSLKKISTRFIP